MVGEGTPCDAGSMLALPKSPAKAQHCVPAVLRDVCVAVSAAILHARRALAHGKEYGSPQVVAPSHLQRVLPFLYYPVFVLGGEPAVCLYVAHSFAPKYWQVLMLCDQR